MGKRSGKIRTQRNDLIWMDTFADLLLLLITFFVLLFAMGAVEEDRLRTAFAFFIRDGKVAEGSEEGGLSGSLSLRLRRDLAALPAGTADAWRLDREAGYLCLRLESDGLFDAGVSVLRPEAAAFLGAMADVLRSLGRPVLVQGYPDTAMEDEAGRILALRRALAVRRHLIDAAGLSAAELGIAMDRAFPRLYSEEDSRLRAWNRRVTFLIPEEGEVR